MCTKFFKAWKQKVQACLLAGIDCMTEEQVLNLQQPFQTVNSDTFTQFNEENALL